MEQTKPLKIVLEGNLSSGKSTLLSKIQDQVKVMGLEDKFEVFQEPIGVWTGFGTKGTNLLDLMYNQPQQHSFEFQILALMSKAHQLKFSKPINIIERGIKAQRNVFIPVLLENGAISKLQEEILTYSFDYMENIEDQKMDLILYVYCPVEVAMNRLMVRNRYEENRVSLAYLDKIQEKYDNWLRNSENKEPVPVILINSAAPLTDKFVQGLIRSILSLGGGIKNQLLQK